MKQYKKLGIIGRFKPLHLGASTLLEEICKNAEEVVIGVGSSNKYNVRNPFTYDQTKDMINEFLKQQFDNYSIVAIDDTAHIPGCEQGIQWRENVRRVIGELDGFVTGNLYVRELLSNHYNIIDSFDFVSAEPGNRISGTVVRVKMAQNSGWESLVPEPVADYIKKNHLDDIFRDKFGAETLSKLNDPEYLRHESREREKQHTYER
jgi:nicotinamide-nucleotide adenylyltransferase